MREAFDSLDRILDSDLFAYGAIAGIVAMMVYDTIRSWVTMTKRPICKKCRNPVSVLLLRRDPATSEYHLLAKCCGRELSHNLGTDLEVAEQFMSSLPKEI